MLTIAVAAGIVLAARVRSGFPAALVLVAAATAINMLADSGLKTIGYIPSTLPAPRWPQIPWEHLDSLLLAAVAVAALGALESLLSATVADAMTVGDRHDPDRELFGQGVANVVAPLFGGIPATAAIARTAVNVREAQAHAWQRCSIRCSCSSPYSSRPGGWARFLSPRSPACSSPQRFR